LENGALSGGNPPTQQRVRTWIKTAIRVAGRPNWVFVKVHTHGCDERNWEVLLSEPVRAMHRYLSGKYNDKENYKLHYVTAREMHNLIKAAESGVSGDPGPYRDFRILPPKRAQIRAVECGKRGTET
jgi:hypothetical protein